MERPVKGYRGTTTELSNSSHEYPNHIIVEEVNTQERTGKPVICPEEESKPQRFVTGVDKTELNLSLGSVSFINRVIDQVRKRQKRSLTNDEKHFAIWEMFMSTTLKSAIFMGRITQLICAKDLTLKQMFDITSSLVSEQNEISGVDKINWEDHSWDHLSLIGEEKVINLQRMKVYVFSDSVLCLGKIHVNPRSNSERGNRLFWFKQSPAYRDLDRIDGGPTEFEWNISQDSQRCKSVNERQTNRILLTCGSFGQEPRRSCYNRLQFTTSGTILHTAWKSHQNTVYWVDMKIAQKKGLTFYQTRSNAIILYATLPYCCIPKVVRMGSGEVMYEKPYASPRPPP